MFDDSPASTASPDTLDTVRHQFEQWRSNRTKRGPIPQHLWEAAVHLCKTHPITHVCRDLRLSFADLKKRLPDAGASVPFMEVDLSCLAGGWRIECVRADGARLSISAGGPPPDASEVLRRFLS